LLIENRDEGFKIINHQSAISNQQLNEEAMRYVLVILAAWKKFLIDDFPLLIENRDEGFKISNQQSAISN